MNDRNTSGKWWVLVVVILALAAWVAWMYVNRAPSPSVSHERIAPPVSAMSAPIQQHPIEEARTSPAPASTAPLPALRQSDTTVIDDLLALAPGANLEGLLVSKAVIPRIVATVDALPGKRLARNILPLRGALGAFQVSETEAGSVRASSNHDRYAPYLQMLANADVAATADWYVRHYPLFQQAYRELGYPDAYFNDRLIAVIDHLLTTPEPSTQPVLVAEKGHWVYANPQMEALSAGQKLMLRAGVENERMIKQKLGELRSLLTGQSIPSLQPASGTSVAH